MMFRDCLVAWEVCLFLPKVMSFFEWFLGFVRSVFKKWESVFWGGLQPTTNNPSKSGWHWTPFEICGCVLKCYEILLNSRVDTGLLSKFVGGHWNSIAICGWTLKFHWNLEVDTEILLNLWVDTEIISNVVGGIPVDTEIINKIVRYNWNRILAKLKLTWITAY